MKQAGSDKNRMPYLLLAGVMLAFLIGNHYVGRRIGTLAAAELIWSIAYIVKDGRRFSWPL